MSTTKLPPIPLATDPADMQYTKARNRLTAQIDRALITWAHHTRTYGVDDSRTIAAARRHKRLSNRLASIQTLDLWPDRFNGPLEVATAHSK